MSNIEITISIKVSVNYLHPSNKAIFFIIKQVSDNTFFILAPNIHHLVGDI